MEERTNFDRDCSDDSRVSSASAGGCVTITVQCGANTARIYLAKLNRGNKGQCVRFANSWLTPNEFQAVSGRVNAKDWKKSIKHNGKSLKLLIEKRQLCLQLAVCRCEICAERNERKLSEYDAELIVSSSNALETTTTTQQKSTTTKTAHAAKMKGGRRRRGRHKKRRTAAQHSSVKTDIVGSDTVLHKVEMMNALLRSVHALDGDESICTDDAGLQNSDNWEAEAEVGVQIANSIMETALSGAVGDSSDTGTVAHRSYTPVSRCASETSDDSLKENNMPVVALISKPRRSKFVDDHSGYSDGEQSQQAEVEEEEEEEEVEEEEKEEKEMIADVADVTNAEKPVSECERLTSAVELLKHLRGAPEDRSSDEVVITTGDVCEQRSPTIIQTDTEGYDAMNAISPMHKQHAAVCSTYEQSDYKHNGNHTPTNTVTCSNSEGKQSSVLARLLAPPTADNVTTTSLVDVQIKNEASTTNVFVNSTTASPGKEARLLNIIRELKMYKKQLMKNIEKQCHTAVNTRTSNSSANELKAPKDPSVNSDDINTSNFVHWRQQPFCDVETASRNLSRHYKSIDVDSAFSTHVISDALPLNTTPCRENTRIGFTADSTGILDLSSGKRKSPFGEREEHIKSTKTGHCNDAPSSVCNVTRWSSSFTQQTSPSRRGAKRHSSKRNIGSWSADDVYRFVLSNPLCSAYADDFRQHLVTGRILKHLSVDQMMRILRTSQTAAQCLRRRVDHVIRSTKSAGCRLR